MTEREICREEVYCCSVPEPRRNLRSCRLQLQRQGTRRKPEQLCERVCIGYRFRERILRVQGERIGIRLGERVCIGIGKRR